MSKIKNRDDEANAFAMELLMPADWLRADIERLGGIDIESDRKIEELATRYRVSRQVMTIRIGHLRGSTPEAWANLKAVRRGELAVPPPPPPPPKPYSIFDDAEAMAAVAVLKRKGLTPKAITNAIAVLHAKAFMADVEARE